MGRVFTYEEAAERQVPSPATFRIATQVFAEQATDYLKSGEIDGCYIYGSAAVKTAGERSDLDMLIALSDNEPANFKAARKMVGEIAIETSGLIPLQPIIQTRAALESGRHDMDRFFGQHLNGPDRLIFGADPAEYMTFPREPSALTIATGYLAQKKRKLQNAYFVGNPLDQRDKGLQRVLELPINLGRKLLQTNAEIEGIPEPVEHSSDKEEVIKHAEALFEKLGLADIFRELLKEDGEYTRLLMLTKIADISAPRYNNHLKALHKKLPSVINWVEALEEALTLQYAS